MENNKTDNVNTNMSLNNFESLENDQSGKNDSYELCQEQENENNFSDEDNEIIDFIKKGICVSEQKENLDSYDIDDIKKFLNNIPNHEK